MNRNLQEAIETMFLDTDSPGLDMSHKLALYCLTQAYLPQNVEFVELKEFLLRRGVNITLDDLLQARTILSDGVLQVDNMLLELGGIENIGDKFENQEDLRWLSNNDF